VGWDQRPLLDVDAVEPVELEDEPELFAAAAASSSASRAALSDASCVGSSFEPCGPPAKAVPLSSAVSRAALSPASCVASSFGVGAVAVLALELVESVELVEVWALAADGPRSAAPTPPPTKSDAASAAAAMGFFM
jgi:hypothetical protein